MNASRTQQLNERLRALLASTPEIEGAALVSDDGLIISSVLAPPAEEDRVAAMSAAMLSLGERIARELGRGTMEQVYIKGSNGFALLTAANEQTVLTIMASNEARLGLLLLELRKVVADLQPLL
ncbi:MAG TPA: roadblock/LC7 domain-containing protein [Anaerolineales bacterium]|nr:roadblock/LC7 domain-containing protein [Anaerolineales bacterium]HRQ93235.1 roadblock/LC7 domain-containing protein [Anaerolineales bacterium]